MQKSTWTLALVWVLVVLASSAFAGHALNSPVATTNPGDFWCSGNADFDGTGVCDGVWTFNADAIFTLDASVGGDLIVTDDLLVVGTLTVTDSLIVNGTLKGVVVRRVSFTSGADDITADTYLDFGSMTCTADRGAVVGKDGDVSGYSILVYVDVIGSESTFDFDIGGVLAFSDTLPDDTPVGWYYSQKSFAAGAITFNAGDIITVQWNETGLWQLDVPQAAVSLRPGS